MSTLIKNVDCMYSATLIDHLGMDISLQEVMGCYTVRYKGYVLMYFLTGVYCFQP